MSETVPNGITLRDYFAAKAMAELIPLVDYVADRETVLDIAGTAFELADVMLEIRNKESRNE